MGRHADPARAREAARRVVATLRERGFTAYLAGGCVRDELLGLQPTDYDVATDATPEHIRSVFTRTAEVGASFGVVLVRDSGATIEVATFRSDGPYSDRRRPDAVQFSDPESDARRRDFTVNALFLDPMADPGRQVIDYVDGKKDIERRIIRAVGDADQRLAEDHLRALRAVRLAARLSMTIEPKTAAAIQRHARELQGVSRERIGDEIRRMMAHPSRVDAVKLLAELGLDAPVLADAHVPVPDPVCLRGLADGATLDQCLAAWALDRRLWLDGPEIDALVTRWRSALCLSNPERDGLAGTLNTLAAINKEWDRMPVAPRKRLAAGTYFSGAMDVLAARDPARAAEVRATVDTLASDGIGLSPAALLDGTALITLGLDPGPRFKMLLDAVYDAQLEGRIRTREAAMELARRISV